MRIEASVDIAATPQHVWDVLTDFKSWPQRIDTVELAELLTPPPIGMASRVRLKQTRLPEGVWVVTAWDPPCHFEFHQKSTRITSVVGHRVDARGEDRSQLTLNLEIRGLFTPIALLAKGQSQRYLVSEAEDIKRAAEG